MIQRCVLALGCLCLCILPATLHSQAIGAASRGGILTAGLGYTSADSDQNTKRIGGVTAFATFDLNNHLGIEADYHYISVNTPQDFGENSFEGGLRYAYRVGRFAPYLKALGGYGLAEYQGNDYIKPTSASYFEYGLGAGVDVRFRERWNLRGEYELQSWPSFGVHGLTPKLLTVGFGYRFR